ncbi:MAG: DUF5689 domain-containing protein [Rikenellaceae bacterium]
MKKYISLAFGIMVAAVSMVGCYNDFSTPEVGVLYSDSDFSDCEIISIWDLKQRYYDDLGVGGSETIREDLVIRGKVISSDEDGNIYKSLYILDHSGEESAAIELKLFASNYTTYPVGAMVYVKLNGLTLGDYRCMLSVGDISTSADYANNNITNRVLLNNNIFVGEKLEMVAADTLVVTKSNYMDLTDDALGRLVRFEDVESVHSTAGWGYKNNFPSYFSSVDLSFDWSEDLGWTPTLAYIDEDNNKYYGSSWYSYDPDSSDIRGQYVVRVSAYAHFRDRIIPFDEKHLDITAIYTRYSKVRSDYSSDSAFTTSQSTAAYQLVLNHSSDMVER